MTFKGILLDLDNTLYPYEAAHRLALEAAFDHLPTVPREELARAYRIARKRVNVALAETAASHNRLLYFQGMCEDLGLNGVRHPLKLYETYWGTFLDHMRPDEGALEFLSSLGQVKVCLVTDLTAHIQHRKIERLRLDRFLHHLVTSEETGREKPHASMFQQAMAKLGLAPHETCMIGDDYEKDILGALALGITPFWLNRDGAERTLDPGVREVRSFPELRECLHV